MCHPNFKKESQSEWFKETQAAVSAAEAIETAVSLGKAELAVSMNYIEAAGKLCLS